MKVITLTQGKFAKVDDSDYERVVNAGPWYLQVSGPNLYAFTRIDGIQVGMHALLMGMLHVDHKNGDGLDNQRSNLRLATRSQQGANRRMSSNNTSGFKGVRYNKKDRKFRAKIDVNYKSIHLGNFDTAKEASIAYDEAARTYYGEFALTNEQIQSRNGSMELASETVRS